MFTLNSVEQSRSAHTETRDHPHTYQPEVCTVTLHINPTPGFDQTAPSWSNRYPTLWGNLL